jgi:hypothetical protein
LNNIIEQDHRFIKKITKPMMGFKAFHSAQATIAGIETKCVPLKLIMILFYVHWEIRGNYLRIYPGMRQNQLYQLLVYSAAMRHNRGGIIFC